MTELPIIDYDKIKNLDGFRQFCNKYGIKHASSQIGISEEKIKILKCSPLDGRLEINEVKKAFLLEKDELKYFIENGKQVKNGNIDKKEVKVLKNPKSIKNNTPKKEKFDYYESLCEEYEPRHRRSYSSCLIPKSVIKKNERLTDDLKEKRIDFCGIGTNKTKRRLNKLAETDDLAKAVRLALEIEDKSISAKKAFGKFRDKIYRVKEKFIIDLSKVFQKNNWNYGIQNDTDGTTPTSHIIFFEIPNCEQISWHFSLDEKIILPKYNGVWDGQKESTLRKIEVVAKTMLEKIVEKPKRKKTESIKDE